MAGKQLNSKGAQRDYTIERLVANFSSILIWVYITYFSLNSGSEGDPKISESSESRYDVHANTSDAAVDRSKIRWVFWCLCCAILY